MTWRIKVGIEANELGVRISQLIRFSGSSEFIDLSPVMQSLLEVQLSIMKAYCSVLIARLDLPEDEPAPAPMQATG